MRTFEDFPVGTELRFGCKKVERDEIIAFASEFDPQPFHMDEEAARQTPVKGLIASGWHTCAMHMRMVCDGYLNNSAALGAPGIDEVRWVRPVRPGMVLGAIHRVVSARVSRSRPDMGLVGIEAEIHDESDTVVMTQRYTGLFARARTDLPDDDGSAAAVAPQRKRLPDPPPVEDASNGSRFASYYDDVVIGARMEVGSYTFHREAVIRFARAYDPQPFHLSDEGAAKTHFGRLAASGWHTAGAYMRSHVLARQRLRSEALARGETMVGSGPSPGIRDLKWLRPVFAGDTVSYDTTVIDKRPHSRPGWGLAMNRARGFNQDGVQVYESSGSVLLPMRG